MEPVPLPTQKLHAKKIPTGALVVGRKHGTTAPVAIIIKVLIIKVLKLWLYQVGHVENR